MFSNSGMTLEILSYCRTMWQCLCISSFLALWNLGGTIILKELMGSWTEFFLLIFCAK